MVPASGPSHAIVPAFLSASRHPDAKAAGRFLSILHNERIRADYRLDHTNVEQASKAMVAVESALAVQAHLDDFRTDCAIDPTIRADLLAGVEAIKNTRQI